MDHQVDLKNVILQKATELFMSQGYSITTIRQIAETAQIGRRYFASSIYGLNRKYTRIAE